MDEYANEFTWRQYFPLLPIQHEEQNCPYPRRTAQLLKSKVVQCYALARHHAITVWGVSDCDQIIIVPNGIAITLKQAIMGVKTQQDFRSPLFLVWTPNRMGLLW